MWRPSQVVEHYPLWMFVDLFLILFDVLSSVILIVMRLLRYIVGKYLMDGVKNKIQETITLATN